jgi:ABC-type branched-subunit amino acid transport system substrate-binding protein
MQPLIMVTNGGDHPSDKWADVTATNIANLIQVDDDKATDTDADRARKASARRAKDRFQLDLADMLAPHHDRNQKFEYGKLADQGDARIAGPFSTYDKKAEIVAQVSAAAVSTPFAEHFATPEVQEVVGNIVDKHFAHVKHNARSWHADKNPHGDNAKALIAAKAAA